MHVTRNINKGINSFLYICIFFRLLRVSTYNLITLCMQKYGIGLTNSISSSTLLSFIIDDIEIIQKSQYDISNNTPVSTNNKVNISIFSNNLASINYLINFII